MDTQIIFDNIQIYFLLKAINKTVEGNFISMDEYKLNLL